MELTALTRTVPVGLGEVAAVVHLAGTLDADTAPMLRERLLGLLGGGHRYLVLEVGHLDAADLTGLGVLASAARRARARGEICAWPAPPARWPTSCAAPS